MRPLLLAMQLMTRIPIPQVTWGEEDFAKAIRWFPATGLAVGVVVAAGLWLGGMADEWTGALLALIAWVGVTGALHIDGLGDIADAAGAAHGDPSRLSAVLADPHIGSFGVTAIVLQLLTKLLLLHAAGAMGAGAAWLLAGVCLIARIGPIVWTLWLPPLHEGMGSRFGQGAAPIHVAGWTAAALCLCAAEPVLLAGAPLIAMWGWWLRRRIGGISGDGHGAGIEIVESGLLAILAFTR